MNISLLWHNGYHRYFGKRTGSQKKTYYSFDSGSWHIVSLDYNQRNEAFAKQPDWLKDDLGKNSSSCILACGHPPLYSSSIHGNSTFMKSVRETLHKAGTDIILNGHGHHYERFVPQNTEGNPDTRNGIRQCVVGTSGAKQPPILRQKPNSETIAEKTFGVLKLKLRQNNYSWQFIPVKGSAHTDSGTAECHINPGRK